MSDHMKGKSVLADKDDVYRHMKRIFPSLPDHIVSLKIECDWSLIGPARITVIYLPPSSLALESSNEDIEPLSDVSVPCMFGSGVDGIDPAASEAGSAGNRDHFISYEDYSDEFRIRLGEVCAPRAESEASDHFSGFGQVVCSYFLAIKTRLALFTASLAGHGPVRQQRHTDHSDRDRPC